MHLDVYFIRRISRYPELQPRVETSTAYIEVYRGVLRNFIRGEGGSTNSVEDRETGDLGAVAPLVRGSGGSCNLVQEISFHIVNFS
jgi:hypothetical protein